MTVEKLPVKAIQLEVKNESAMLVTYWANKLDMTPGEFTRQAYGLMRFVLDMDPDEDLAVINRRTKKIQNVILPWRQL